ncbi:hypothetical protein LJR290_006109 [Variovorax sp. LjRoot290]|uniref:hypothetical protein n=1 Tax=Variovorax sp. LjRoot290 TaxID=3342316 RepID=UPI003ED0B9F4
MVIVMVVAVVAIAVPQPQKLGRQTLRHFYLAKTRHYYSAATSAQQQALVMFISFSRALKGRPRRAEEGATASRQTDTACRDGTTAVSPFAGALPMPFLAPTFARLPPLAFLLADQMESRKKIARHLGVSLRTLQRYQASGNAPRAIYLALWFESRWGMAALHAQAFNEAQHARAWVGSLERECERLRGVIRALENAQGQAAANSAVFNAF